MRRYYNEDGRDRGFEAWLAIAYPGVTLTPIQWQFIRVLRSQGIATAVVGGRRAGRSMAFNLYGEYLRSLPEDPA